MTKRKGSDGIITNRTTPQKRQRRGVFKRTPEQTTEASPLRKSHHVSDGLISKLTQSEKIAGASRGPYNGAIEENDAEEDENDGSPTPRANGKALFTTPQKRRMVSGDASSKADESQSARRRHHQSLAELRGDYDDDAGNDSSSILLQEVQDDAADEENPASVTDDVMTLDVSTPVATPSKRGRPKGSKNRRSPTPEGDIPPEERYFFQNRTGPVQLSRNVFSSVHSLTHDEYFQQIRSVRDSHEAEKAYLMKLHARSFPQWKFELAEGFSVCLYGYGSKRKLVHKFAQWIHSHSTMEPLIVVINGFTPKLNLRTILSTIGSTLVGEDEELRLVGHPQEMLHTLLSYLSEHPPRGQLIVMINSIDADGLRRSSTQGILARLAAHPLINVVATTDTPTFSLLWNSTLLDQFNFTFHDCSTFATYDAEINVVDDVHDLLGRKGRRTGGKEGIGFVLKSLPENARNLYRVLLREILSILTDGVENFGDEGQDIDSHAIVKPSKEMTEEIGVEYRSLYQKASEEFICSSDMNFKFLLKEFHDHQMITSRRDASGTELLGVPLGKEDIELVLEDLGAG